MDPRRLEDAHAAMTVFIQSVQVPIEGEDGQIFMTLTHKESCWLHFATVLAIDSIATAAERTGLGLPLLKMAMETDEEMWDKILGSVRVQIFGQDPETNDKTDG
jgi:hypothetical protein